jgi:diketogulonate reductase-like aldo/keto reductase
VLLHSPLNNLPDTLSAWKTLESYVSGGQIRNLGISNTPLPILKVLWDNVNVKPAVVQNRFCREEGGVYDQEVRRFCRDKGIIYQSFWTLSANPQLLNHTSVQRLAGHCSVSREVAMYALVLGLNGTCILNGTKNHMVQDVLEMEKVMEWVGEEGNSYDWQDVLKHFKDATGDNNPEEMPVESADAMKHVRTRERNM